MMSRIRFASSVRAMLLIVGLGLPWAHYALAQAGSNEEAAASKMTPEQKEAGRKARLKIGTKTTQGEHDWGILDVWRYPGAITDDSREGL
jgi:hypothetical protein